MSHDEIRNKILKTLYQRYYDESLGRPLDTNEILKQTFPNDEPQKYYPEVNYLDSKGLIHGTWTVGYSYPLWIRIEEYGIDTVERFDLELRDLHYKRRLKILGWLYQQFFDGNNRNISTDEIVKETKIGDPDSAEVIQEFNYLHEKGLIDSSLQLGRKSVSSAKISSNGIDEAESILNHSLQEFSSLQINSADRSKIEDIKNEQNIGTRFSKAIALSQELREWADIIIRAAQMFISGS